MGETKMDLFSKVYFDSLMEGSIKGSKCKDCNAIHLPPRPICPYCGGNEMDWVELKGEGTIQAFTIISVPLSRMEDRCPYTVIVARLNEGPSVSGILLDVKKGDRVSVGAKVRAEFVKEGDEIILCFRLAENHHAFSS
jgi:uncharacterized OB-fold protein